jgi:MFS family permease
MLMQNTDPKTPAAAASAVPWYRGVTRYQWLVLVIASLGWVFDVFEGQIFVASMRDAMPALLGKAADDQIVSSWNNLALGAFLLGGALGGVVFGILGDKIGRSRTMIVTILFYSLFTCVTAFAQAPWQMVVFRFLVAMGVGGEWAVASAMVAEVMSARSRPVMSSIFHASSVLGTLLAVTAGAYVVGNPALGWRWGFAIGVFPALLTLWVRWKLREPNQWQAARQRASAGSTQPMGRVLDLLKWEHLRNTIVGVTLATIGLVTFWGVHIYGKDALLRRAQQSALKTEGVTADSTPATKAAALTAHRREIKRAEMLSMALNTTGGGLGLLLFGAISNRLGRKGAFVFYHAGGFIAALLLFKVLIPSQLPTFWLGAALPIFGFLTLGMHAGYAVYFPELYPTRLRGTGAGFCFNMGRLGTAGAMILAAQLLWKPQEAALFLSPLFALGIIVALLARETRGEQLPD